MPDNNNSLGDSIAPAQTSTSRSARAVCRVPFWLYSTPTQRRPSNNSRVVCELALNVTLGRARAGNK